MIRIDLHTHSTGSHDGGLSKDDYRRAVLESELDLIAVTDHRTIKAAQQLKLDQQLKSIVVVGQEIRSTSGDIVGLYLTQKINDGRPLTDTISAIHAQGGFVLVPHPGDPTRSSIGFADIQKNMDTIDAIESLNGRRRSQSRDIEAIRHWAAQQHIPLIAASDAHSYSGIGRTYTTVSELPDSAEALRKVLKTHPKLTYEKPSLQAMLAPKLQTISKLVRKKST